ncbi:MAG TPA: DUF1080 domain-containing protein, partial [Burkholderiales bacterium]|nr:DUF1080 domain-containing protein [Burkholderiales bacterium]
MDKLRSIPAGVLLFYALAVGLPAVPQTPGPGASADRAAAPNTLTAAEVKAGWRLLFDGKTMDGWRGAYMKGLPERGWEVKDGTLTVLESGGGEAAFGGDIVTVDEYSSFDLCLDFRLTEGANSGIKYFVIEAEPRTPGSAKGLEYQLLDDVHHPDAKLGIQGNRTCASLYDLLPAVNKPPVPVGAWNSARIVVRDKHVQHWLNGVKVLEYERGGPDFLAHKARSKFKDIPG